MDLKLVAVLIILGLFAFLGCMFFNFQMEQAERHNRRNKFSSAKNGKSGCRPKC